MLQELYIHSFAIIEEIHCRFDGGMTALTGETGAGKSIIIDAVGLLAGERASLDMIRYGAPKAMIQGLFSIESAQLQKRIEELGIEMEENQLLIQRELFQNGKTSCRVNGRLATVGVLKQIGELLIDIHGQNEHFVLLNPEEHLTLLDQFAKEELADYARMYREKYEHYIAMKRELAKWMKSDKADARRMDMLEFQISEIQQAHLKVGEEEKLVEKQKLYAHFQTIEQALQTAGTILQAERGVVDQTADALASLKSIEQLDASYTEVFQQVQEAYYQLQDAAHTITDLLENASYDEEKLNKIEERLATLHQLKKKYGDTEEAIIRYAQEAQEELEQMESKEERIQQLQKELVETRREALLIAKEVSRVRQEVAKRLTAAIHQELSELYMEKVQFEVRFEKATQLLSTGIDSVEFYVATNVGEPLKPLAKIASGGELSRLTLALKSIFASNRAIQTIIFDEVDTGVSGRVAQAIAHKMKYISQFAQVLCITHLPQVASAAHQQYRIEKEEYDERTHTKLTLLDEEKRIEEVARMLSGETMTSLTMEHAKELLLHNKE